MVSVRHTLFVAAFACGFGLDPPPAQAAADFGVEPLRVELSAARRSGSLRLRNNGDQSVLVQVDAVSWAQREGRDVLVGTQSLIVSPPLFRLGPKATQTIRVGIDGSADSAHESTFRVLIREVAERPPGQTGLATVLQLSLPVFVAAAKPTKPELVWQLASAGDGKVRLTARNLGTSHAQIADVKFEPPLVAADTAPAGYLLHGQSRFWEWASKDAVPTGIRLTYRLNGQTTQSVVQLGE